MSSLFLHRFNLFRQLSLFNSPKKNFFNFFKKIKVNPLNPSADTSQTSQNNNSNEKDKDNSETNSKASEKKSILTTEEANKYVEGKVK